MNIFSIDKVSDDKKSVLSVIMVFIFPIFSHDYRRRTIRFYCFIFCRLYAKKRLTDFADANSTVKRKKVKRIRDFTRESIVEKENKEFFSR